jgi:hypothetical protein
MRRLEINFDPVQISLTNEEILSDLLYPSPPSDTGGADSAPPTSVARGYPR